MLEENVIRCLLKGNNIKVKRINFISGLSTEKAKRRIQPTRPKKTMYTEKDGEKCPPVFNAASACEDEN